MKKRLLITAAALMLILSAAGCGQTNDADTAAQDNQNTEQTDVSDAYTTERVYSEDQEYSEYVDMDAVVGEEATSESSKDEYEGTLGNAEITISDAKLIQYEDEDVAVVSFKYKNTGDEDMPFTGALKVEALQNNASLPAATVVGVEGVEMLSMVENVSKGDTITVQKAYKLRDRSQLTVQVTEFNPTDDSMLVKTFDFE
ncbi:MAG: DUF5067 domain-containing protein [Oscillospiraceae bacterium]|nr:DUF5067 domain-containing protein [Oscillospiraceae bacterium]